MNFEELGLAEALLSSLERIGYEHPTPIQLASIPPIIAGRDMLGCAQTGTGKTAAFALPILHRLLESPIANKQRREIRSLVLSPTRELAAQIAENFNRYAKRTKLRTSCIFGGVSQRRQTDELERGVDILVATPGRLLDLMEQGFIDLGWVESFVLDEADHMLDIGFMPAVRRIIAKLPKQRQNLMFSATMPPAIAQLADEILKDPEEIRFQHDTPTADRIEQGVYFVKQIDKPDMLAHFLLTHKPGTALAFVRTKYSADGIVKKLERHKITAVAIHGNKSQNARQRALKAFQSGEVPVLIATDIASRGIDVSGIEYVFNYDLPNTTETYIHRIGRTARAGLSGTAISFCAATERDQLNDIERMLKFKLPRLDDQPAHLYDDSPAEAPEKRGRPQRSRSRRVPVAAQSGRSGGAGGSGGGGGRSGAGKPRSPRGAKSSSPSRQGRSGGRQR